MVKRTGEAGTDGSSLFVAASGILFCFLLPASADVEKFRREVCCSGPREGRITIKRIQKGEKIWPSLALSRLSQSLCCWAGQDRISERERERAESGRGSKYFRLLFHPYFKFSCPNCHDQVSLPPREYPGKQGR